MNASKVYINWVMSKYGQELIVTLGDYPVRADAGTPNLLGTQLPPFSEVYKVGVDDTIANQAKDQEDWNVIFGYTPE